MQDQGMHRVTLHGSRALAAMRAAVAAFVLVLAACAGPGDSVTPPPFDPLDPSLAYLTDVETAERVRALRNDATSIANGFMSGAVNAAIEGVPYSFDATDHPQLAMAIAPVPHLRLWNEDWSASTLATGTFEFDEATMNWTYAADPSDELIARWRSQSSDASQMELRVAWEPQVGVTYPADRGSGFPGEVPTGWHAVLRRNDVVITDLAASFAFRTCSGVRMAEPTRLTLGGFVGDGAARLTVNELVLEAVDDDALRLATDLAVRSGSLQLGVAVSLSAAFALERDAACWPEQPDSVDITGTLAVTGPGPLTLVRGDVTATYDAASGAYAFDLRNGRFVSGDKRVDLVASVGATEPDPASRLFMTFAGGVIRDVVDFVNAFGLAD